MIGKSYIFHLFLFLLILPDSIYSQDNICLIPQVESMVRKKGTLSIERLESIHFPDEWKNTGNLLVSDLKELANLSVMVNASNPSIHVKKVKMQEPEMYMLEITKQGIIIEAGDQTGMIHAFSTLLQLILGSEGKELPRLIIHDKPRFSYRGVMIDCSRHFWTIEQLKKYTKQLAFFKLNTLHLHLTDNQGWRLYLDQYPDLAFKGTYYRTFEDLSGHYYRKSELQELINYAAMYGIEIIPEIDIPAHSLAFSHYKPELGSKEYGMDHLDLFNPEVYTFFDALFKEYLEGEEPVFRGNKVHVGTDEYSNAKKEVVEKFRAFTDHYIRYIESFGKQACVWGALTHAKGDTPVKSENVIMNAWYNGYADPKEMIKQGYHLISIPDGLVYIVPQAGYYYDYLNTKSLYEKWTPAQIGKAVFEEKDPNILGGMFAVWNDHVGNGISNKDIHHRVYPALQTLAVKMWTGKQVTTPYDSFNEQRNLLSEAPGVNQLGRIGKAPGLVYEQAAVTPNRTLPYREIGYNYLVSFDIKGADEAKGTELFRSPDAVFYLSDPISGMLGFARDGYLNTFNYRIMPGEHATVGISGDNRVTRLHINGKIVEELNIQKRFYNGGKDSMNYVRTLVFPLQETGNFKSQITNLKVYRQ